MQESLKKEELPKLKDLHPLWDNVFVEPYGEESRISEYGIITPTTVDQEKKSVGKVLKVGPDVKAVKPGDKVLYAKYAGEGITTNEKGKEVEYHIVLEKEILMSNRKPK